MATRKSRHWIKWWSKETIWGSFMRSSVTALGFFVKVCCLSNESRYPGYLQAEYQVGMTHEQLASLMQMSLVEFETELSHQMSNGVHRMEQDKFGVIKILKWDTFQSIPSYDGNPDTVEQTEMQPTMEQLPSRRKGNRPQDDTDPDKYIKGKHGHMVIR